MKLKPIQRRARAEQDVRDAMGYYLAEASSDVALRFVDALEAAMQSLQRRPAMGSPRYAEMLGIAGLRHWRCKHFPYLIFYREEPASISVWRVLHEKRDALAQLAGDASV